MAGIFRLFIAVSLMGLIALAGGAIPENTDMIGYFQVESIPSGAEVTFDSVFQGETPLTIAVPISSSPPHTLGVTSRGYLPYSKTLTDNPPVGQTVAVVARLEPVTPFGTLVVTSSPGGALITVDGGNGQQAPWTYQGMTSGPHVVQAFLSGYQPFSTQVNIPEGGSVTVNAMLNALTQIGSIQVKSSPSGADVYVDGFFKGHSDITVGSMQAGNHIVRIRLAGYEDWTSTVLVTQNAVTIVDATLAPASRAPTGDIEVSSTPVGAAVFLDGAYQGMTHAGTPLELTGIAPGDHLLELTIVNYQDYNDSISVAAGQTSRVNAILVPGTSLGQSGSVQVNSDPSGANVFLDDALRGITPLTLDNIPAGTHSLVVQLAGYNDYTSNLTVTPGQVVSVHAGLVQVSPPTPAGLWNELIIGALLVTALLVMRRR
ncbi:hypothetical protein J2741_000116 [Methanolinea mesophila]|uniref:PEGA domain-containing protein n=1 Tax=Methanolinea mesophila TaxID=547055 RepID=UPI001AE806AA|nr:PEGA domain-containing protein [Methanolinea mesophila]MBP1927569.1 hypothetical protein [Methanolinea mesophila]